MTGVWKIEEIYEWGGGHAKMWICPICGHVIITSNKEIYLKIAEHMSKHR